MGDDFQKSADFQETPLFNPFSFDMGERWGREFGRIEAKLEALEVKTDNIGKTVRAMQTEYQAEFTEIRSAIKVLDERTKYILPILGAVLASVIAGFILQYLT